MKRRAIRRIGTVLLTLMTGTLLMLVGSPVANADGHDGDHRWGHHGQHHQPPRGHGAFIPLPDQTGTFTEEGVPLCGTTATIVSTMALEERITNKRGDTIDEIRGPWIIDLTAAGFEPVTGLDIGGLTVYVDHQDGTSTLYFYGPAVILPTTEAEADLYESAGLPRDGFYFRRGVLVGDAITETHEFTNILKTPRSRHVDALCGEILVPAAA